ncbi:DUF6894 family protein [Muricoccus radiodurans]|uniref:DUF6894 family protein n=1 Tax=Muricoccus radiodurans TaxID=2231721 RepID=UPI003CED7E90
MAGKLADMPRYHFHVSDGRRHLDHLGTDLPSTSAAQAEGIRLAGEIIKLRKTQDWAAADLRLDVTDNGGVLLFSIDVAVTTFPAVVPEPASG